MLDLQHLKTFMVIAATKSFTRAAIDLGYCQSSVTHHVKILEHELGVRLLDRARSARQVALTPAGHALLDYAKRILTLVENAKAAVRLKS
jgi:DNA-binding transcriptional LysR family regulator